MRLLVRAMLLLWSLRTRVRGFATVQALGRTMLLQVAEGAHADGGTEFSRLGVTAELVAGLGEQGFGTPTPVQKAVVPRLLSGENLVMAAATGSGKTLAFILPAVQKLAMQEQQGYVRQTRRPRCLVLVPTRELARQVLGTVKALSHYSKVSSCAVLGGEQYGIQKKNLDRLVDLVVASPGRLTQHKEQGNLHLSQVDTVIIDEVDTMLMQGFGPDIRAILRTVMMRKSGNSSPVQLVMATATLTKAVRALLTDVNGGFNIEYADPTNKTPPRITGNESRIELNVVEVDGLHRSLPNVRHNVEEVKGVDKIVVLKSIMQQHSAKPLRTLIFCNSVDSVRAVQYALNEAGTPALSYHGDLNSREREANLDSFRAGENQYMVCTDIAARGLDIPEIDHVVMFDFPLNPVDYLHRAGRCGRAGRKGMVTSVVGKRDKVLSDAVQSAIARGLPLDNLSSSKRDYEPGKGKLAQVLGRRPRTASSTGGKPKPKPKPRSATGNDGRTSGGAPEGRGRGGGVRGKRDYLSDEGSRGRSKV